MRKAAGLNDSYVYLSYDSLARYGDILSGKTSSQEISEEGDTMLAGGINCYEAIMPNPVDGIAAKIVKESAGVDDRYISVIDNTDRFWDQKYVGEADLLSLLGEHRKRMGGCTGADLVLQAYMHGNYSCKHYYLDCPPLQT